jgi:CheY-like chemotaxis protein
MKSFSSNHLKFMDDHAPAVEARAASSPAQSRMKPVRRILVIDDDRDIRQLYADVLGSSGYHVESAADGGSGWQALHAASYDPASYDLLITDHNMPNLSGLELVRKMRAARMALPVILAPEDLPAVIRASIASEASSPGLPWNHLLEIAAILPKPFTVDELLRTVKDVLRT